jgi:hypothetical protein
MSRKSQNKVRRGKTTDNVVAPLQRFLVWENWLGGLLLAAATVLVYQQAWHAGYVWDDDVYVTENKLLTAPLWCGCRRWPPMPFIATSST